MGAKNQLYQAMTDVWEKKKEKIIDSLSREDGWEDRIHYFKEAEPDKADLSDDEIIAELVWDRYADFMSQFLSHAEDHEGKLMAYRCIGVDDEEEFIFHIANGSPVEDYNGLGVYWAWDESKAQCHWGAGASSVTIHALVPFSSIDPWTTLELNCHPTLGEDEAEVRLKEGAPVEVIGVEKLNGEYVSPLDHGEKPIRMQAKKEVKAFQDQPFTNAPDLDPGSHKTDQLVEVGLPETPQIEIREALMVRPYYLGNEKRWMPDACKFPAVHKMLKPEPYKGDSKPPELPKEMVKEEEMKPEYPAVDEITKPDEPTKTETKSSYPAVEFLVAAEEMEAKQSMKVQKTVENQGKGFEDLVRILKGKGLDVETWNVEVEWKFNVKRRPDKVKKGEEQEKKDNPSFEYVVKEDDRQISIVSDKSDRHGKAEKGMSLTDVVDVVMQDFWKGSEEK